MTGNTLRIELNSAGGPVTGELDVELTAEAGIGIGSWDLDLSGTYDPGAGTISGDVAGSAQGSVAGISGGDRGTGTFTGSVDLRSGVATIVLGTGGDSQTVQAVLVE